MEAVRRYRRAVQQDLPQRPVTSSGVSGHFSAPNSSCRGGVGYAILAQLRRRADGGFPSHPLATGRRAVARCAPSCGPRRKAMNRTQRLMASVTAAVALFGSKASQVTVGATTQDRGAQAPTDRKQSTTASAENQAAEAVFSKVDVFLQS